MCFRVKRKIFAYLSALVIAASCGTDKEKEHNDGALHGKTVEWRLRTIDGTPECTVAIDTMDLRNPYVRFDRKSNTYYMFGDGGVMWNSKDMREWKGPYNVFDIDTTVWYSSTGSIVAPEVHKHKEQYYYLASFERMGNSVATVDGSSIAGRSCIALVADDITGPYRVIDKESELLVPEEVASHPTFITDEFNAGYMIYTHVGEQSGDGSFKIIRFNDAHSRRLGEAFEMFKASEVNWIGKRETNGISMQTTEAPYIFITDEDKAGMLFTANNGKENVIGVAYTANEFGHWLNGPWIAEPEPLVSGNVSSASIFTDYDGTQVMTLSKDTVINGKRIALPQFIKVETQFEKLEIKGYYNF